MGKLNINIFRDKLVETPIDYELLDDRKRKILGEVSEKLGRNEPVPLTAAFVETLKELGLEKQVRAMVQKAERQYRWNCLMKRGDDDFEDPYADSDAPYANI